MAYHMISYLLILAVYLIGNHLSIAVHLSLFLWAT